MKSEPWGVIAALMLGAACAATGSGATKVSPGQEFLYSGTAEHKLIPAEGPEAGFKETLTASALVSEADPERGYQIILMQNFAREPRSERPPLRFAVPPVAYVNLLREGSDTTQSASPGFVTGPPFGLAIAVVGRPVPRGSLKVGQTWQSTEKPPLAMMRPVEVRYTVVGETKENGRPCLKLEKQVVQKLPLKVNVGPLSIELMEFRQTLFLDAGSGELVSQRLHAKRHETFGPRSTTVEIEVSLSLRQTRQLAPAELASRVKQAEALQQIESNVHRPGPAADRRKSLEEARQAITAFRQQYPKSPYAPVLERLDASVTSTGRGLETTTQAKRLQGSPAPAFSLKTLAGEEKTLGEYRGKLILLNFFASW
jgi:hypothetical protein